MVRDAVRHSRPDERLERGRRLRLRDGRRPPGRRATRRGTLRPGVRPRFAVWDVERDLLDPASGLPRLQPGRPAADLRRDGRRRRGRVTGRGLLGPLNGAVGPPSTLTVCGGGGPGLWRRCSPGWPPGLAWQPYALWPLLLVGVPALTLLARGQPSAPRVRPRLPLRPGHAHDDHLLGARPRLVGRRLLIAFMALFFGVLGLRALAGDPAAPVARARAACWVAVELAYSSFPFGGFGWTRLAYAAVDTPLNGWFPLLGVAGVSFLVALVGQVVAWVVLVVRERRPRPDPCSCPVSVPRVLPAALVLVVLGAAGVGLRAFQVEPLAGREGSVTVGVVQGNVPGRGIEALGRARTVTNNHLSESVDLMARARLGQTPSPTSCSGPRTPPTSTPCWTR